MRLLNTIAINRKILPKRNGCPEVKGNITKSYLKKRNRYEKVDFINCLYGNELGFVCSKNNEQLCTSDRALEQLQ
jgi:hypothetical protein